MWNSVPSRRPQRKPAPAEATRRRRRRLSSPSRRVGCSPVSLRLPSLATVALLLAGLAVFALGGHSRAASPSATAVASPACAPLQGDSKQRSLQMNDAIRLVLEGANWQAGGTNVGFQACDDSNAKTGLWTQAQCQANANA